MSIVGVQLRSLEWNKCIPTIGTLTPRAASAGAKGIDILSPTPPVLCLSQITSFHLKTYPGNNQNVIEFLPTL